MKWRKDHINEFVGGVLVIRNPYKAILSYWNFEKTQSHTEIVQTQTLLTDDFIDFSTRGIDRWLQLIEDWIYFSENYHVIFYEVEN